MIVVDTHVLAWGVQKEHDPKCPDGVDRALQLIKAYSNTKQPIVVPAIVLAEYLAGQCLDRSRSIHDILGKAFFIAPFDTQCADIAGALYDKRTADSILAGNAVSRVALKDDYKILATAIALKASHLYTHDNWIGKIEQRGVSKHIVKVMELPPLRTPDPEPEMAAGQPTFGIQGSLPFGDPDDRTSR